MMPGKNKIPFYSTRSWLWPVMLCCFLLWTCSDPKDKQTPQTEASSRENLEPQKSHKKTILFFGNSLTAGYRLQESQAFPALIQEKLDSIGLNYKVINAGVSGETTAGGLERVDWILKQRVDIFVLELGANDGLRGIDPEITKKNLQAIIDKVDDVDSSTMIVLAGMQIPPSMGNRYTERFKEIFPELARENDLYFVPFLLEGVAGRPKLNQSDGIHPTVEGQKLLAENVWNVLENILEPGD